MQKFIMMVGVPGSGKSTKAKELSVKYNAKIFSSDEYRKHILGSENDQSDNEKVFNVLKKDMLHHLKNGGSAILDACNINSKRRIETLNMLINNVNCYKIAYVMRADYLSCVNNDNNRERNVGENIIKKFISAYEIPFYCEGFDYILIDKLSLEFDISKRKALLDTMRNFNQENPHHVYDLLEHNMQLSELYPDNCIEKQAAMFHDIGKYFTKSYDGKGIAHYYAHSNWSVFTLLNNLEVFDFSNEIQLLECLFIINNHMKIRDIIKNEKTVVKYKKLWGTELFGKLIEFMRCDNIASGTEA